MEVKYLSKETVRNLLSDTYYGKGYQMITERQILECKEYMDFIELKRIPGIGQLEQHHIIPRYASGSDEQSNIIFLLLEDHYIAHEILWNAFHQVADSQAMTLIAARLRISDKDRGEFFATWAEGIRNSKFWNAEEFARTRSKAIQSILQDPIKREKWILQNSKAQLEAQNRPEVKLQKSKKLTEYYNTNPEECRKISERQTERMKNKDLRDKTSKATKESWTDERKKDRSEKSKKLWENPEYRKQISAARKAKWADPVWKAAQGKKISDAKRRKKIG